MEVLHRQCCRLAAWVQNRSDSLSKSATVLPGTPGRVRGISWWSDVWNLSLLKGPQVRYPRDPLGFFRACFWVSFFNDFLEPNDPPNGAKLGPMLGHCWSHVAQIFRFFQVFIWHLNLASS